MRRPSKLGTLALSAFLIGYGAVPILQLNHSPLGPTLDAIVKIAAIAAGVLIWLDR
jgi:hypothetical protein